MVFMAADALKVHPSWHEHLAPHVAQPYMADLRRFLLQRKQQQTVIYPAPHQYFSAFNATPWDKVRVVILGQDPYHGQGQAHGLCFSVPPHAAIPPSLLNIDKELCDDLGCTMPEHGCLLHWAQQGVLLLNSVLTVEAGRAGSHQGKGWEQFTDAVIALLNAREQRMIFVLWGAYAQKKASFVNQQRHLVLQAPHPSPLSSYRGFFGQRYFSRINADLQQRGETIIDWQLPDTASAECEWAEMEALNQRIAHG